MRGNGFFGQKIDEQRQRAQYQARMRAKLDIPFTTDEQSLIKAGRPSPWIYAGRFFLNCKQYRGRCIHDVAQRVDGILFLEWLRRRTVLANDSTKLRHALEVYFADPRVQRALLKAQSLKSL